MARLNSKIKEDAAAALATVLGDDNFILVELAPGGLNPVYDPQGQLLKFRTGDEAGKAAVYYSKQDGKKYQPRPIPKGDWKKREATRMKDGTYTLLPWHGERWWRDLEHIWGEHYPHVSINKIARLSYTENAEKGSADVQTPIKVGKYLVDFFGEPGVLSPFVIRDLCTTFSAKFEDNMLLWAETEEEIEDIYVNGPNSCMSKPKEQFYPKDVHPCCVYATPDFKVAYIRRDGRAVARATVCIPNKTFNVIYGDRGRLEPLLVKAGFNSGSIVGGRLKKVVKWESKEGKGSFFFVVPHLDNAGYVEDRGDKDYIFVTDGSKKSSGSHIECGGARGISEALGNPCSCGLCLPVRMMLSVYTDAKNTTMMCKKCASKVAFQCTHSGYWVMNEHGVALHGSFKGRYIWDRVKDTHSFVCQGNGLRYHVNDKAVLDDGRQVSLEFARVDQNKCGNCGHWGKKNRPCARCDDYNKKMHAAAKGLYISESTASTRIWRTR